jgi:hypothetical protein
MEIVGTNKRSWQLVKRKGLIRSGYNGAQVPVKMVNKNGRWTRVEKKHEIIDNVFFITGIKLKTWARGQSSALLVFEDWLDDHEYTASVSASAFIFFALQDGNHVVTEDGYIHGLWTFRKMGSNVSIWPCYWDGDTPVEYVKGVVNHGR